MRPIRLAATALLLLCASVGIGASDPIISKSYSYFNIRGLTGEDLDRELSKHGPILTDTGIRHPGATRIKLGGSVDYGQTGDASKQRLPPLLNALRNLFFPPRAPGSGRSMCAVTNATVRLETHLTLPRWTDRDRAGRETVLIWDTLLADIKRHEERHAEIARQYARKLESTLEGLHPERTCEQMEAKVDATSKAIIEEHKAAQRKFDHVEAASFERRMTRMLRFKVEQHMKNN